MQVLYAAMRYDYGNEERGYSYEYDNFFNTMVNAGYEVVEFDYMSILKEYGREAMNKLLIETVKCINPDILFCTLYTDQFDYATIRYITECTGTITVCWFSDDIWRFDSYSSNWCRCFDFVTTTDCNALEKYRSIGYPNAILTQFACNHFQCMRLELPQVYDVSFIGQPYGDRINLLYHLQENGINVHCWGSGWPNGKLSFQDMVKVFNMSKINLNFSAASAPVDGRTVYQIKARVFEVPGCGGFLLTENSPGLENYYNPGSEIDCFNNAGELVEKIRYYLGQEDVRKMMGINAYVRTNREHTYEKRFRDIFGKVLEESRKHR